MKDKLEELLKELLKVVKVKAGESAEEVLKIIKEYYQMLSLWKILKRLGI